MLLTNDAGEVPDVGSGVMRAGRAIRALCAAANALSEFTYSEGR